MEPPTPTAEHKWLTQLVGDWRYESEMVGDDPAEYQPHSGEQTVTAVGDVWIQIKWLMGDGKGGQHTSFVMIGFDPDKGKFVGSFHSSMMTMQWIYEGDLVGNSLVLIAPGPDFNEPGKTANYRDVYELVSPGEMTLTSEYEGPNGTWEKFMRMRIKRV